MTRVKREFQKKGLRLESDFEFLPTFDGIETVEVDPEKAIYSIYHVSAGWTHVQMQRDGKMTVYDDDLRRIRVCGTIFE